MDDKSDRTGGSRAMEGTEWVKGLDHLFACVQLTTDDSEETARVYTDVFLQDEPTSRRYAP